MQSINFLLPVIEFASRTASTTGLILHVLYGSIQMHIGLRRSYKYNGYIGVSYCSCGNVLSDISAMNVVSEKDVTLNSFLS
jgi:hypothetical protein